jgi:hypothetical protein
MLISKWYVEDRTATRSVEPSKLFQLEIYYGPSLSVISAGMGSPDLNLLMTVAHEEIGANTP